MKKLIGFTLLLMILSSCDPVEWLAGHDSKFYIKNLTNNTLTITTYPQKTSREFIVAPNDSIMIYGSGRSLGDKIFPPFEDIHVFEDIYVYDTEGNVFREWHMEDMTAEEHSIFKEETWKHYKEQMEGPEYAFIWVYDICEGL